MSIFPIQTRCPRGGAWRSNSTTPTATSATSGRNDAGRRRSHDLVWTPSGPQSCTLARLAAYCFCGKKKPSELKWTDVQPVQPYKKCKQKRMGSWSCLQMRYTDYQHRYHCCKIPKPFYHSICKFDLCLKQVKFVSGWSLDMFRQVELRLNPFVTQPIRLLDKATQDKLSDFIIDWSIGQLVMVAWLICVQSGQGPRPGAASSHIKILFPGPALESFPV